MQRQILKILLVGCVATSLAACGSKKKKDENGVGGLAPVPGSVAQQPNSATRPVVPIAPSIETPPAQTATAFSLVRLSAFAALNTAFVNGLFVETPRHLLSLCEFRELCGAIPWRLYAFEMPPRAL